MSASDGRPRVLHVVTSYPPNFGGIGSQLRAFIPHLSRLDVVNTVLTSHVAPDTLEETIDGAEVCRLPRTPGRRGHLWFALRACWWAARRRAQFDVVHYHGADWPGIVGVPILRLLGKKTVVTLTLLGVDDPLSLRASRLGWVKDATLRRTHRVVGISSALAAASRAAGWSPDGIREIPYGVDVTRRFPLRADDRRRARQRLAARFGFHADRPLVCFVGAVIRRKGIDLLMTAWPAVAGAVPGATLLLVGPTGAPGDSDEFSRTFVDQTVVASRQPSVLLAGPMDDPTEVYCASDVFVLPSRREGLPNVVLEACACGVPCVVADMPGVSPDVIRDGATGLVVPQEDPAALSAAIIRLLTSPDLRELFAARGRALVVERYALDRVAAAMVREYEGLAGQFAASNERH